VAKQTGRPRVDINWDEVKKLLRKRTPKSEIAAILGVSVSSLDQRCPDDMGKKWVDFKKPYLAEANIALRESQMELAKKNPAVSIWLGKQYLGQVDSKKIEFQIKDLANFIMSETNITILTQDEHSTLEHILTKLITGKPEDQGTE
jgi:hypothetical protein